MLGLERLTIERSDRVHRRLQMSPRKPHMYLLWGLWHCIGSGAHVVGFTPKSAFVSWETALTLQWVTEWT